MRSSFAGVGKANQNWLCRYDSWGQSSLIAWGSGAGIYSEILSKCGVQYPVNYCTCINWVRVGMHRCRNKPGHHFIQYGISRIILSQVPGLMVPLSLKHSLGCMSIIFKLQARVAKETFAKTREINWVKKLLSRVGSRQQWNAYLLDVFNTWHVCTLTII